MGEAKQKSRNKKEILDAATRCVYCDRQKGGGDRDFEVEHMPPRGMFKDKQRPSGWEFASCVRCNSCTSGADAVAQLVALIDPVNSDPWKVSKFRKLISSVSIKAPSVARELRLPHKVQPKLYSRNGLLHQVTELHADGPAMKAHLDVFSAKMAMATFANYIGRPIGMSGMIYTQWYLNVGMPLEAYHSTLAIMPKFGQLEQGKNVSGKQFNLNYNTDKKSIVAGCISFHGNLSIVTIATDGDDFVSPLTDMLTPLTGEHRPGSQLTRPGLEGIENLGST